MGGARDAQRKVLPSVVGDRGPEKARVSWSQGLGGKWVSRLQSATIRELATQGASETRAGRARKRHTLHAIGPSF